MGHEVVMKQVTGTTRAAGPPGRARGGADGGGRRGAHQALVSLGQDLGEEAGLEMQPGVLVTA